MGENLGSVNITLKTTISVEDSTQYQEVYCTAVCLVGKYNLGGADITLNTTISLEDCIQCQEVYCTAVCLVGKNLGGADITLNTTISLECCTQSVSVLHNSITRRNGKSNTLYMYYT